MKPSATPAALAIILLAAAYPVRAVSPGVPVLSSRIARIAGTISPPRPPEVLEGRTERLRLEMPVSGADAPTSVLAAPVPPVLDFGVLSLQPHVSTFRTPLVTTRISAVSAPLAYPAAVSIVDLRISPNRSMTGHLPVRHDLACSRAAGIPYDTARMIAAKIVFDGLMDGSLDLADPQWRPYLVHLIANPAGGAGNEAAFKFLLSGCGGGNEADRIAVAEKWVSQYKSGMYAGDVLYFVARRHFNSGDYARCIATADALAASSPHLGVRAGLLAALAKAYLGDMPGAHAAVREAREKYPDSDEIPETRYMEAWLALQELREADARAILEEIIRDTPEAPAAEKAGKILEALGGWDER